MEPVCYLHDERGVLVAVFGKCVELGNGVVEGVFGEPSAIYSSTRLAVTETLTRKLFPGRKESRSKRLSSSAPNQDEWDELAKWNE